VLEVRRDSHGAIAYIQDPAGAVCALWQQADNAADVAE